MRKHLPRLAALRPEDADAAGALLRGSFDQRLHRYVPYCQQEVGRYLATMVEHPVAFADRQLHVVRSAGGELASFAEFRALDGQRDLLAYICVADQARGQGLAERMIREHVDSRPHVRQVVLDVFADNVPARRLYRRLGFEDVDVTTWWSRGMPDAAADTTGRLRVRDWHVSLAALQGYGFCVIDLDWSGMPMRLGMPSSSVLRLPDEASFRDDGLLSAVRALVPTLERALWISESAQTGQEGCERVVDSWRLRGTAPLASVP